MKRAVALFLLYLCGPTGLVRGDSPCRFSVEEARVVVLGNSITEGYIDGEIDTTARYSSLLEERLCLLGYDVEVVNSGRAGDTSRDGSLRIDEDGLRYEPRVVTISFGPNDYYLLADGLPRVGVEAFALYMRSIVDRVVEAGARPILLSLVPVIPDRFYTTHDRSLYDAAGGIETMWTTYDEAVRRVTREANCGIVDLHLAFGDSLGMLLGDDGGHPNERGHRAIANALLPFVVAALEAGDEPGETERNGGEGINDLRIYPNPFLTDRSDLLRIAYIAPREGRIRIDVYSLSGKHLATPVESVYRLPGPGTELWDGRDRDRRSVPPGLYLLRVSWTPIGSGRASHHIKKVTIVR